MNEIKKVIFNKERNTLLFSVEKEDIAVSHLNDYAKKAGMVLKKEFSITLIGYTAGKQIEKLLRGNKEEFIGKVNELTESLEWTYWPMSKYYRIKKGYLPDEIRESIIERVFQPSVETFYEELNSYLGTNFEVPPMHVTLFTKSTKEQNMRSGIGILTEKELSRIGALLQAT